MLLAGLAGACKGINVPLRPPGATVGKRPDNDVVLSDDYVSRRHARIEVQNSTATLVDEGSTNGSFVNEVQVRLARLRDGDRLRFGNCVFHFRASASAVLVGQEEDEGLRGSQLRVRPVVQASGEVAQEAGTPAYASASRALKALTDLGRAVRVGTGLEEVLDRILGAVFEAVAVDRGAVVLVGEEGELRPQSVRWREGSGHGEDMPVSTTLARRALEEGSAILVPDARIDPELCTRASVVAHGICCAAYVPFLAQGEPVGLLCVDTKVPAALTDHHVDILGALADEAGALLEIAQLREDMRKQTQLRLTLQRYMASQVVEEIIAAGGELDLTGREDQVTVLFADLRGFTATAEALPAAESVALLNVALEALTNVVFKHHGTLDKYIGDGLMALFGAPFPDERQVLRACLAAVDMHQALVETTSGWSEKYGEPAIGVAIHTGRAVVGNVGTKERVQYTAIGDVVNVTARLEEIAGPHETLVSGEVAQQVQSYFDLEPLGVQSLRGRQGAVAVHRLTGAKAGPNQGEI